MILWTMTFTLIVDTFLIGFLIFQDRKNKERYIKLEEWTEDWLKRMAQKVEAADQRSECIEEQMKAVQELLPKDGKGEVLRNQILLREMNDEMERGLKMEKEWNDGVASILNYGKPIRGEDE